MTLQFTSPIEASNAPLPVPAPSFAPLRLGFLSPHNPFDRRTFSGTAFFAAQALAARSDVDFHVLGPHRKPRKTDRLKAKLFRQAPAQPKPEEFDLSNIDIVLGLVATPLLKRLQDHHDTPCIHVTDATPNFLRGFYGWDVPAETDVLEQQVVRGSLATIYSSDYMAARARREMGNDLRTFSVPFGINLENVPTTCPQKPKDGPIELLFVCSDWQRKGGNTVLAILDRLRAAGSDVRLSVVGSVPENRRQHPGMTYLGFLDKNRPDHAVRLTALYRKAHLLLLPTQGDCTPMVVAEAMAHGTPVLASNIGGIPSLLAPGTGTLLDVSAPVADWTRAVEQIIADRGVAMSKRAFQHARTTLTWDNWANGVTDLARNVCDPALAA